MSVASISLIIMGKLLITATCVLVAWAWITSEYQNMGLQTTPIFTYVLVGISSWLIARMFLSVYIVVIDAGDHL